MGDHDHLPVVRAGALQDRDAASGGHVDHRAELVEHQRPRRAGVPGRGVQVGEREHGDRGGLVGHVVRVGAPHHDGAGFERLDESDGDGVAVRREPWREDLAPGGAHHQLEPHQPAGEVLACPRAS